MLEFKKEFQELLNDKELTYFHLIKSSKYSLKKKLVVYTRNQQNIFFRYKNNNTISQTEGTLNIC